MTKGSFMLCAAYAYGYERSRLSALCIHYACIFRTFPESWDADQKQQYHWKLRGAVMSSVDHSLSHTGNTHWTAQQDSTGWLTVGKLI